MFKTENRTYGTIPCGLEVRGSIANAFTYRVHRGNGYYGSRLGELIQMKYIYNVSDPTAAHCGAGNKTNFAAAVAAWQALGQSAKDFWDAEARRLRLFMSGYNLYIRKYRLGEL